MPFDAAGTYTPPTGAENAFAGKVIASATWNSIFTDIASALTQVAGEVIASATYCTASGTNAIVLTPVTPFATVSAYANGMKFTFKSGGNNSAATTLAVGALAAKSCYNNDGTALSGGEITSGAYYEAVYDSALNAAAGGFHILDIGASGIARFTNSTASTTAATGAVVISGGLGISGAFNAGAASSISSSAAGALFTLNSTDAGATAGPQISLYRNSASPAVSDIIGGLVLGGNNSSIAGIIYGAIYGFLNNVTAGAESGDIRFDSYIAGVNATRVIIGNAATAVSSTTGTLIVTGGVGVSGPIFAGTTLSAGTTISCADNMSSTKAVGVLSVVFTASANLSQLFVIGSGGGYFQLKDTAAGSDLKTFQIANVTGKTSITALTDAGATAFTFITCDHSNGRVGINTASPGVQLEITGSTRTTLLGVGGAPTHYLDVITAGTTSLAPLRFAAGTNLTTAAVGCHEFDGVCFYVTAVASSRQVIDAEQFVTVQGSDVSLSNSSTSPQNIFASANDVLSLAASTTYFFEALFLIATGTTTHTTALGFVASSAFTSIQYFAELWSNTSGTISTTAPSVLDVAVSTATVLNATSAAPFTIIRVRGNIRTNAASTVTPQITFSAGPTGTCATKVNSWFRIWPVGSNVVAAVGNWA